MKRRKLLIGHFGGSDGTMEPPAPAEVAPAEDSGRYDAWLKVIFLLLFASLAAEKGLSYTVLLCVKFVAVLLLIRWVWSR